MRVKAVQGELFTQSIAEAQPELKPIPLPVKYQPAPEPEPGQEQPVKIDLSLDRDHQFALYRAWRSTALFFFGQRHAAVNGEAKDLEAAIWYNVNKAGEVWRAWATVEPFKHTVLNCVCWECLFGQVGGDED